ncbi:aldose epimerase family protein [Vibrio hippocampi]|uniref:Aldose 1-epimerase n=1 Tax=Vibrio hippocampi TaxID=654686 RepID=A0ABM8ZL55_9VIBR|nr:aldose epimerase family protein [Vibrio hippocampi]CAH0528835.1 Aldose 1-epimerase [Vibrio hippocampi]
MTKVENSNVQPWGNYQLISLTNNKGSQVDVSDLGATIVNFYVTNSYEERINIVLGYDKPSNYIQGRAYLGCVVGPWANRIANGKFRLDGHVVQLETNEGTNHLHGGKANIGAKCWEITEVTCHSVKLICSTLDGEAGYPCDIDFTVEYKLGEDNGLAITYSAIPSGITPINMTQHAYFNLDGSGTIENHSITLNSDRYLHIDEKALPTRIEPVDATPFDLRTPTIIANNLHQDHPQLISANGFDHCWVLDGNIKSRCASLTSNLSGLTLDVYTDQSGIQFYSGNFLNGEKGRMGQVYNRRAALCLETQCYPNQVNMPSRDDCLYDGNRIYQHKVIYRIKNQ